MAADFFNKLCTYPPAKRYDAKNALKHPWITGEVNAEIPSIGNHLQLKEFDNEQGLRKAMRSLFFMA